MRPKPGVSTEKLQTIFLEVFDTWFIKSENPDAERWLDLRNRLAERTATMCVIKSMLHFIWQTPVEIWNDERIKEMRAQQIEAVNRFLDEPIVIENDFLEELDRVLNVEIGIIENDINFAESEMKDIAKSDTEVIYDFYKELQSIEEIHGRTLNEKMLLPMFVANKVSAIKKARLAQAKNGKK